MKEGEEEGIQVRVVGLVLDPVTNAPILILRDSNGNMCLPVWIGVAEATSIASAMRDVEMQRPMTHDLMIEMLEQLGGRISRVVISRLEENTFYADIELVVGESVRVVDSRPSDAVGLAVRVDAPIYVARSVMKQAQVELVEMGASDQGIDGKIPAASSEDRNFSSLDVDQWKDVLEEMDPKDFKYKM